MIEKSDKIDGKSVRKAKKGTKTSKKYAQNVDKNDKNFVKKQQMQKK